MKSSFLPLMLFLSVLAVCSSQHQIYYVLPHGELMKSSCPTDTKGNCHTLSHYVSHEYLYFKSNTTMVFLRGNHILDKEVSVTNTNNLVFTSQWMWRAPAATLLKESVRSIASITCLGHGGFEFWNSSQIEIRGIRFAYCTGSHATLYFYEIGHLVMSMTSVENNTAGLGMMTFNVQTMLLISCTFASNGLQRSLDSSGGNVALLSYRLNKIVYTITNLVTVNGYGYYGGLSVVVSNSKNVSLFLNGITASENTGFGSGGNININVYDSIISCIEMNRIISTEGRSVRTRKIDRSSGAGLSLYLSGLNCLPHTKIVMSECKIHNNFAEINSGMSIVLQNVRHCSISISKNVFSSNGIRPGNDEYTSLPISIDGGGIGINNWNVLDNEVTLLGNNFTGNAAFRGGAFLYDGMCGTKIIITNTLFENNSGNTGVALTYFTTSLSPVCQKSLKLVNVSVIGNFMNDASINSFQYHGKTYSKLYYINSAILVFTNVLFHLEVSNILVENSHNISGMSIYGCDVIFTGNENKFVNNNSPVIGGALIITSSNSFVVNVGSHILFANNTAVYDGGAIYIKESNNDDTYVSFLLYDRYITCSFRTNASADSKALITFEGNKALNGSGDDLYGGTLEYCKINDFHKFVYEGLQCPIQEYWSLSNERSISSSPIAICLCTDDDNMYNCSIRTIKKLIYPGQFFSVSLVAVGMCKGISKGVLVTRIDRGNLTTSTDNQLTAATCKEFIYSATPPFPESSSLVSIDIDQIKLVHWKPLNVSIDYLTCPPGFKLAPHSQCMCNDVIQQSSINVLCNINNSPQYFNRPGSNWIAYFNQYNCTVAHTDCPFDYCNPSSISFNVTHPDSQCSLNRVGTLCGQCQSGHSLMLGSNECASCSNVYLPLIVVFVAAGFVLIAVLIVLDLTVSSGRINGLIFYANVVKLNESVYFRNGSIPVLSQFISWLNLDLGFETCFFNGLDAYWKTWLQFVFPAYLWLLVIGIIIGCRYSSKLSRCCGKNAVPVLATILLMSYTKLLRNITNVLMLTTLSCKGDHDDDDNQWVVWSVDPTLNYFSTSRIPLLSVSLLLLMSGLIYTVLVFSTQWFQRYSYKCFRKSTRDPTVRLKPLIDSYCGPYKDSCRYWTGLLLIARVLLTGIFSFTAGTLPQLNNLILIGFIILLTSLAWLLGGVYRTKGMNALEILSYLNIGFLSLATQLSTSSIVIGMSISLCILILVATIFLHFLHKMNCRYKKPEGPLQVLASEDESLPGSPAMIVMRRESLIFDFIPDPNMKPMQSVI